MARLKYLSISYIGARDNNEDSCIAIKLDNGSLLFAVADGMGGANAGEVASKVAVNILKDYLSECIKDIKSDEEFLENMKSIVSKAYLVIQTELSDLIIEDPYLTGMGSTLVVVLLFKDKYIVSNIGDSRAYLIKDGKLILITEDHSYLQEFKNTNSGPVPEFLIKSYGHLVTRILNGGRDKPDIFPEIEDHFCLMEGEGLLLCSDGLIPAIALDNPESLEEIISLNNSLKKTGKRLIDWAEKNGSKDNISLVLVK